MAGESEPAVSSEPAEAIGAEGAQKGSRAVVSGKRSAREEDARARQAGRIHDLRDMLTLLRTFEVTSGVARRKDLKRIESVLEELQLLARHWT